MTLAGVHFEGPQVNLVCGWWGRLCVCYRALLVLDSLVSTIPLVFLSGYIFHPSNSHVL